MFTELLAGTAKRQYKPIPPRSASFAKTCGFQLGATNEILSGGPYFDRGFAFPWLKKSFRKVFVLVPNRALLSAFPASGIADYFVIFREF
jgi:hypothetical protein